MVANYGTIYGTKNGLIMGRTMVSLWVVLFKGTKMVLLWDIYGLIMGQLWCLYGLIMVSKWHIIRIFFIFNNFRFLCHCFLYCRFRFFGSCI